MNIQKNIAAVLVCLFAMATEANAEPIPIAAIDEGVTRLAQAVSAFFDRERHDKTVFVGAVTNADGDGDSDLRQRLVAALEKQDFTIRRAKLAISGRFSKEFRPEGKSGPNRVALRLKAEVRDRETDDLIQPIAIPIFGVDAISRLNPNAEVPPDLTEDERHEKLNVSIDNPETYIDGTIARTTKGGDYGVEVVVSGSGRKLTDDLGFTFVELTRGDEYVVRLHNSSKLEAAVSLSIDGLSMYSFSQDGSFGSQVLVPAQGSVDIPGWYINDQKTDAFEIGEYAESAAASNSIPKASVGTISARFHAAWEASQNPPSDEAGAKGEKATKRGRQIDQKYVIVERVVGKSRAFVTVRYNR